MFARTTPNRRRRFNATPARSISAPSVSRRATGFFFAPSVVNGLFQPTSRLRRRPTNTNERPKERPRTRSRRPLVYPFRGLGGYVYWSYVALMVILLAIGMVPGAGCAAAMVQLLVFFTLPGLLFAVVRTSARGETELPDWPDWSDFGERVLEWFGTILAFVVSMVPAIAAVLLLGCGAEEFLQGETRCGLALGGGLLLGAAIWIPAFGAVAETFSPWWALRIDLHVRALVEVGVDAWKTFGLLVVLMTARVLVGAILAPIPLLGGILQIAISMYALLVGAHFIGLLFRRNAYTLDRIYS